MLSLDLDHYFRVVTVPVQGLPVGVAGGTGDLQQFARLGDIALLRFLRLDERIADLAKKAVACLRISTSSRGRVAASLFTRAAPGQTRICPATNNPWNVN